MRTLCTSVGRLVIRKDSQGEQSPAIVTHTGEHSVNIQEMILWSSLMWNILTIEELRPVFYRKEREVHVLGDRDCEDYLKQLVSCGLVIAGRGLSEYEALYNLVKNLHIKLAAAGLFCKIGAFLKLTFVRQVPVSQALALFSRGKLTQDEKTIMRLTKQQELTIAELIMCVEKGIRSLPDDETLLDALYCDDKTTCYNMAVTARFCGSCQSVLQAVVDLYLRKEIIFVKIL